MVSIHPMCRFKDTETVTLEMILAFQYILCVGSSLLSLEEQIEWECFNTSYVSVQAGLNCRIETTN